MKKKYFVNLHIEKQLAFLKYTIKPKAEANSFDYAEAIVIVNEV